MWGMGRESLSVRYQLRVSLLLLLFIIIIIIIIIIRFLFSPDDFFFFCFQKREKDERETLISCLLGHTLTRDRTWNQCMWPSWVSNQRPYALQDDAQPTAPHRSGPCKSQFKEKD